MRHAMKATTAEVTAIALMFAADAIAAGAGREDTSGLFVWAFLGVCALIVLAQAVPAILMTFAAASSAAKALRERRALKEQEVSDSN